MNPSFYIGSINIYCLIEAEKTNRFHYYMNQTTVMGTYIIKEFRNHTIFSIRGLIKIFNTLYSLWIYFILGGEQDLISIVGSGNITSDILETDFSSLILWCSRTHMYNIKFIPFSNWITCYLEWIFFLVLAKSLLLILGSIFIINP